MLYFVYHYNITNIKVIKMSKSKNFKNILLEDYQEIDTRTNGQKFKDGAWTALGVIFFPITAVKYLISGIAMEGILPAGGYFGNESILKRYENGEKSSDILNVLSNPNIQYNKITTASGYKTGKVTIINDGNQKTDISKRKLCVYFMGNMYAVNNGLNENVMPMKKKQHLKNHDFVIMEHVSGGWNVKPSIECGIALVQNALDAGYRPENIDFIGHSLGGGISAQVLNHFKDKEITFGEYINTCSFSKTSDFVGKNKIVSGFASLLDIQLDTESVINNLPVKHTTIIKTENDRVMDKKHLNDVVKGSDKILRIEDKSRGHIFPIDDVEKVDVDKNRAENTNYVNEYRFKNQISVGKVVTPFFAGLSAIPASLVAISVMEPQIWENINKSVFEFFDKIAENRALKMTIASITTAFSSIATVVSLYMISRNVISYYEKKDQIQDMKDNGYNIDDEKIEQSGFITKLFCDIVTDTQEKTNGISKK
jgi:hypothetical protein